MSRRSRKRKTAMRHFRKHGSFKSMNRRMKRRGRRHISYLRKKMRNPDKWTETKRLLILNGNNNHVVSKIKESGGYRFVYRKKSSFAPSLEKAKDMLSAIAELGRWPG